MNDLGLTIQDEDPRSVRAQIALEAYVREVRETARLTHLDVKVGLEDVEGFRDDGGAFLIALDANEVVGCVGLRPWKDRVAEIKRMWVSQPARGRGVGALMLDRIEQRSRELGYTRLVLDTNSALTAALRFYGNHGYRRIERYNDNWDATHFFGKDLGS